VVSSIKAERIDSYTVRLVVDFFTTDVSNSQFGVIYDVTWGYTDEA